LKDHSKTLEIFDSLSPLSLRWERGRERVEKWDIRFPLLLISSREGRRDFLEKVVRNSFSKR
jgi:hypothetical protein